MSLEHRKADSRGRFEQKEDRATQEKVIKFIAPQLGCAYVDRGELNHIDYDLIDLETGCLSYHVEIRGRPTYYALRKNGWFIKYDNTSRFKEVYLAKVKLDDMERVATPGIHIYFVYAFVDAWYMTNITTNDLRKLNSEYTKGRGNCDDKRSTDFQDSWLVPRRILTRIY